MTRCRSPQRSALFTLRTFVLLVAAVLFGLGAGWLAYQSTAKLPTSVMAAVSAFGACLLAFDRLVE